MTELPWFGWIIVVVLIAAGLLVFLSLVGLLLGWLAGFAWTYLEAGFTIARHWLLS